MKIRELSAYLLTLAIVLWSAGSLAAGNYTGPNRDADGHIVPTPKGEKCVEETAAMRANHMEFLLHKRNETMRQGIRTKKNSLVECINCHATPGEDGKIARITDPGSQHFCASCHRAASVKLDCFECHADRPVESFSQAREDEVLKLHQALADSNKPHAAMSRKVQ